MVAAVKSLAKSAYQTFISLLGSTNINQAVALGTFCCMICLVGGDFLSTLAWPPASMPLGFAPPGWAPPGH